MDGFLPISKEDMISRGIKQFDFICVTGDSYVDHPTFGMAIISRVIESHGFSVGMIAQPNFNNLDDIKRLGEPKYSFFVNSGNIDSMVSHYTVAKRKRTDDAYTAGGKAGKRPDRALTVYCNLIKKAFPNTPIVIGGLEASLRRFAHYDYWLDDVMPSIMLDTKADIMIFGMGELQTKEIIHRLSSGESISDINDIRGTCYLTEPKNTPVGAVQCPDFSIVKNDKVSYAKANKQQMVEQDEVIGKMLVQRHGNKMLVQNKPMRSLTQEELDKVYALPFQRTYHPIYEHLGGVKAIEEVEFSITHNRGCFGACNFCAITFHQGRTMSSRSKESVVKEAELLTKKKNFKGYIHDVGGPTANFRDLSCDKQIKHGLCKERKCLAPTPCNQLKVDHSEYLEILRAIRSITGIKKVFIRSGIRYDFLLEDKNSEFFNDLVEHHVSGQLKVAPEHCSNHVLDNMGKPHIEAYLKFSRQYFKKTNEIGKEQYLVPYLMSSHPGSRLEDAVELAVFLKNNKIRPEQVQDFYPTPGTVSTCMYYTGLDPYTLKEVYIPKLPEEKSIQRALLQYYKTENKTVIIKALKKIKRYDLIGDKSSCLVSDKSHIKSFAQNKNSTNSKKRKPGSYVKKK